jgi:hypothetical protein
MINDVRPSPIAGTWYPGTEAALQKALNSYLGDAPTETYRHVWGVMVPHAGMRFSGAVAGRAFRHLCGRQYDVVVVIGPSHYPYRHDLLTTGHHAYRTPLGDVPVAQKALETLREYLPIEPVRLDQEHSIEIELPFLQHVLGDFEFIPIAMMNQAYSVAVRLAEALFRTFQGQNVLYVASSDLSHFYDQARATILDQAVLDAVAAYDAAQVIRVEERGQGFACGRGAIAAVMLATRQHGASIATVEHHATSGEVNGDLSRVVGYGAVTFHN